MNLPEAFKKRTESFLGKEEFNQLEKALDQSSPVSVRVNDKSDYIPSGDKVEWCKHGYYLPERPLFTADPLFHAGLYYVQEASSMFLQQIADEYLKDAKIVLDLCAAPGGKSTLLSNVLEKNSLLVSNEIMHSRANILAENMIKWGNPNFIVTHNEPKDFSQFVHYFDAIVIDAPCSGEGMFRKDKKAVDEWSEQNVLMCAQRQKDILQDVWCALKPGGILVYSTCTYNREENEENVAWISEQLGAEVLNVKDEVSNDIVKSEYGYRFYPHKIRGEGFSISVLRKNENITPSKSNKNKKHNKNSISLYKEKLPFELKNPSEFEIIRNENKVFGFHCSLIENYILLISKLRIIHSGIELGEIKGKDFIPSASIALSKKLDKKSVSFIDVDYDTAIRYLQKQAIFLQDAEKGYNLITYKNQPLGWIKNIGNRWNNLYPNEWRIRMRL